MLSDPALAPLLGALTAGPTPDELAGQHAALAMYRAARAPSPPAARLRARARVAGGRAPAAGGRARGAYGRTRRGALAAVTSLAVLAGGFAAAHWLLGFPGASPGAVVVSGGRGHPVQAGSGRHGGNPGYTPSGTPGSTQIHRRSLLGPSTRPMPQVSLRLLAGKHNKSGILLVRCQFTAPGDVVWLLVRHSSRHPGDRPSARWQTDGMARLSKRGKAVFEIRFRVGLAYRVVVLATAAHGRSVSKVIVFTARDLSARP